MINIKYYTGSKKQILTPMPARILCVGDRSISVSVNKWNAPYCAMVSHSLSLYSCYVKFWEWVSNIWNWDWRLNEEKTWGLFGTDPIELLVKAPEQKSS